MARGQPEAPSNRCLPSLRATRLATKICHERPIAVLSPGWRVGVGVVAHRRIVRVLDASANCTITRLTLTVTLSLSQVGRRLFFVRTKKNMFKTSKAVPKFHAWTDEHGVTVVAKLLGLDLGYTSHLRVGRRVPSLRVAARIERATAKWKRGPIRCIDWIAA